MEISPSSVRFPTATHRSRQRIFRAHRLSTFKMAISSPIYNFLVRRNYVFLGVIFASAFGFEMAFDKTSDRIWDSINKGRQWKDIRSKYIQAAEEDDDDE